MHFHVLGPQARLPYERAFLASTWMTFSALKDLGVGRK